MRMTFRALLIAVVLALGAAAPNLAQQPAASREPDVVFVPTPPDVVDAMLKLAKVTSSDTVRAASASTSIPSVSARQPRTPARTTSPTR
jgi:hypothetical protein